MDSPGEYTIILQKEATLQIGFCFLVWKPFKFGGYYKMKEFAPTEKKKTMINIRSDESVHNLQSVKSRPPIRRHINISMSQLFVLTPCMLGKNFSRRHFYIFFLE